MRRSPGNTRMWKFEPIHGSAPDIAGQGKANPLAAIWSASQMLDFFGHEVMGSQVLSAIEAVLEAGRVLTPDLGGTATTRQTADRVLAKLCGGYCSHGCVPRGVIVHSTPLFGGV